MAKKPTATLPADAEPTPEEIETYQRDPDEGVALYNKNRGILPDSE